MLSLAFQTMVLKRFESFPEEKRKGLRIKEDASRKVILDRFSSFFGKHDLVEVDAETAKAVPNLAKVLEPQHFALRAGRDHWVGELEDLPSVRVALEGSRVVVMCRIIDMNQFIKDEEGNTDDGGILKQTCFYTFRTLHTDKCKAFCQKYDMFHATLGPHDVLYVPTGYMLGERTGERQNIIGMRASFVINHICVEQLIDHSLCIGKQQESIGGQKFDSGPLETAKKLINDAIIKWNSGAAGSP
jgi:hypothetical protein